MKFSLATLAELTGAKLHGDPEYIIHSVADLDSATPLDMSFLANSRYVPLLTKTKAGAICIGMEMEKLPGKNYLISKNPSKTFQQIVKILFGHRKTTGFENIHPTAIIHETAKIDKNVCIGPYAVVDKGTEILRGTYLGPFCYVGTGTKIGIDCYLHAHTIIREHCQLGDRVILQPGSVIGSCGFGYITDEGGKHTKLEQLGNVILEDDVEIGANTTIDRARFKTTRIKRGTKIDNLVQIAHNVELGENNLLAAQTGIAGTTKTGKNVLMGGQAGVVGHLEISDFVLIATRSGVSKSIKKKGKYAGSPVIPLSEYNKNQVYLRNIETYIRRIELLEKKLKEIEKLMNSITQESKLD